MKKKSNKFKIGIIIISILFLITLAAYFLVPPTSNYFDIESNVVYLIMSATPVFFIFLTFKIFNLKSLEGKTWFLLFLGFLGWFIGDLLWVIFDFAGLDPFPSIADIFYLAAYIPLFMALVFEYNLLKSAVSLKNKLIAGIIILAITGVVVYTVLIDMIIYADYRFIEKFVSAAYPIGDLVIVFFALIVMLTFGKAKASKSWLFIGLGLIIISIADTLFAYLEWNEIFTFIYTAMDIIFVAGFLLVALGAYYHRLIIRGEA